MRVFTATVTVYVEVYDDTVIDERRRKQMETSLHQGAEEVRSLMTDHGKAEVSSSTLLELGPDDVPVWVNKTWRELEDLQLEPTRHGFKRKS